MSQAVRKRGARLTMQLKKKEPKYGHLHGLAPPLCTAFAFFKVVQMHSSFVAGTSNSTL